MLKIDHRGTGLVLALLETLEAGLKPSPEAIREICSDPGYVFLLERTRAMVRQFGGDEAGMEGLTTSELERCLSDYAEGRAWQGHRFFGRFGAALDQARANPPRHREIYAAVGRLEPGTLEQEVLRRLPAGATIDSTAYFLAEVHSNAYAYQHNLVVSFWPLELVGEQPTCLGTPIEAVLKHEMHHIGLRSVLPDSQSADGVPNSPEELVLGLVGALSGEGAATMFFTPYDAPGSASPFPWDKTAQDLPVHYRDMETGLRDLLSGRLGLQEGLQTLLARFLGAYEEKHLPAIYVMGVDMCRRLVAERGETALVELLRSPAGFLVAYNEASAQSDGYRFSQEVICAVVDAEERGQHD